ncbi:MAG: sialidase family protein [Planctomycetota bacterium]
MKRRFRLTLLCAGCLALLATPAFGDDGLRPLQAPDGWSAAPERPEPGGRPGPRQVTSDETRMIAGDLVAGPGSRWLGDILVGDPTFDEVEPAMHKAPDGTLFIAVEQYGVDWDGWVRIYRSVDGGQTWAWLISFITGNESRNPAITYAERASGDTWLYLAYEATMSDTTKRIMVIRVDPNNTGDWTAVIAASGITGTPSIYPRICTDNLEWPEGYYVYVTYTVNAIDYYPVMFTRSLDYGLTYSVPQNITGGAENSSFVTRPDVAYGTAGLFVAFEKLGWSGSAWTTQVWVTRSTNYGGTWNAPVQLTTSDDGAWHPSVAAAVGVSTVMVAYTQSFASQTDIFCAYSTNGGDSYSSSSALPRTFDNEKSVALSVSDSGGRYHAAYWRAYDIEYTYTDATSPLPWAAATLVNEDNWASSVYSRPAICVNPTKPLTHEAGVAWTDYRGSFYDVYFDAGFYDGACCYPDESCTETTETDCIEAGGSWQGSGVECDPDLCLIDPCDEDVLAPTATLDLGDFHCVPYADSTPIIGTATDPEDNLQSWALEERGMGAAPWTVVAEGFTPIVNGVFTNWSPAAPGYRMLRLTVTDACGHAATDVHLMYADRGPQATINYPTDGAVIGGSAVCIDGLVSHGVCAIEWLAEYRPAAGVWTYLADGTGAVYNLPLTHWDTTSVPDGLYEISVSASSIGGVDSQTVGVTVDNTAPIAEITSPENCDGVTGTVQVTGTAYDANLSGWSLWYTGGEANNWVLINSGEGSVVDGVLADWDTSNLMPCPYTLKLAVGDQAKLNCTSVLNHTSYYYVSVIVGGGWADRGDINCDGAINAYDIDWFIDCVSQGYCDPCP